MGGELPKQYLPLAGRTVIEHALARLCVHPQVGGAVVAVAATDAWFSDLPLAATVRRATGGAERADSVLAALEALAGEADDRDWALVHDAVRPCLHPRDLERLIARALDASRGALLATPVRDTMKRARGEEVVETVARDDLWHALTPQLFPVGELRQALETARRDGVQVTDEAQAMERLGRPVLLVQGRADNIKITRTEDLALAGFFLQALERES
jgi:2-C-methyl-D-erythritol 4-phosphate cytidylyltransferase